MSDQIKIRYIEHFAATFLATWCANNYDEICARGEHDRFNRMPVEDAVHLGEQAWKQIRERVIGD
jgi:hypothetical protein